MNIQEIRDRAPRGATGYYFKHNSIWYCYIHRGRVYKIVGFMKFNEGRLKYFKEEIKPLY